MDVKTSESIEKTEMRMGKYIGVRVYTQTLSVVLSQRRRSKDLSPERKGKRQIDRTVSQRQFEGPGQNQSKS